MQNNNNRLVKMQENKKVFICPPCGNSTAASGVRGVSNKTHSRRFLSGIFNVCCDASIKATTGVEAPRLQNSEMTALFDNDLTARGFTLIELLVVVLIIGILAAVALPQYNKAVAKTRGTLVISFLNSYSQAEDTWSLEHSCVPILDKNGDILDFENDFSSTTELDIDLGPMMTQIEEINPRDLGWGNFCSDTAYIGTEFEFRYSKLTGTWKIWYCEGRTANGEAICNYIKQQLPVKSN